MPKDSSRHRHHNAKHHFGFLRTKANPKAHTVNATEKWILMAISAKTPAQIRLREYIAIASMAVETAMPARRVFTP